ncbi:MAG: hypothetical protein ACRDXX_00015, partial [Stackebrandtia sp.]
MSRLAQRQLERLTAGDARLAPALDEDPPLRRRLQTVLGASEALGDHLAANPDAWQCLRPSAPSALEALRA